MLHESKYQSSSLQPPSFERTERKGRKEKKLTQAVNFDTLRKFVLKTSRAAGRIAYGLSIALNERHSERFIIEDDSAIKFEDTR